MFPGIAESNLPAELGLLVREVVGAAGGDGGGVGGSAGRWRLGRL
jgi:hypothetical protein